MAIYAICVVKNEADIIAQTLNAGSYWADRIFVLDNGSDDGTWEIIEGMARTNSVIVPVGQDFRPFRDNIRSLVFRQFAHVATRRDWWCILDADEFYIDDPRRFLRKVPAICEAVWQAQYNYCFTDADYREYCANPEMFDGSLAWNCVLKHYHCEPYGEIRFFRHWWGLQGVPPANWGPVHHERIRLRHFPYRSPDQIVTRIETRAHLIAAGEFAHERSVHWQSCEISREEPWRQRMVPALECLVETNFGSLVRHPAWAPPAMYSQPSSTDVARRWMKSKSGRLRGMVASLRHDTNAEPAGN